MKLETVISLAKQQIEQDVVALKQEVLRTTELSDAAFHKWGSSPQFRFWDPLYRAYKRAEALSDTALAALWHMEDCLFYISIIEPDEMKGLEKWLTDLKKSKASLKGSSMKSLRRETIAAFMRRVNLRVKSSHPLSSTRKLMSIIEAESREGIVPVGKALTITTDHEKENGPW